MADKKQATRKAALKKEEKPLVPRTKVESNRLKLLVTIVNRPKAEFYMDVIQSYEANVQIACQAQGTAPQEIRKLLGLVDVDKTVIFSIIKESRVNDIMYQLAKRFRTVKGGSGIAYTIPLSSVIGVAVFTFLSNNKDAIKEN